MEYFAKFSRNVWRVLTTKIYETVLYNSLFLSESLESHDFFFRNKFVFHSYSSYLYNPCLNFIILSILIIFDSKGTHFSIMNEVRPFQTII